jgi:hypothetical protein
LKDSKPCAHLFSPEREARERFGIELARTGAHPPETMKLVRVASPVSDSSTAVGDARKD